jgi:fluoride ion exporter CrcB/FEX
MSAFTSFPFIAVHAADLCVLNGPVMGVGYILVSIGLALVAFELGFHVAESLL